MLRQPARAVAGALLYSLIETTEANRREPYWYLRAPFEQLPLARARAADVTLLLGAFHVPHIAIEPWFTTCLPA